MTVKAHRIVLFKVGNWEVNIESGQPVTMEVKRSDCQRGELPKISEVCQEIQVLCRRLVKLRLSFQLALPVPHDISIYRIRC